LDIEILTNHFSGGIQLAVFFLIEPMAKADEFVFNGVKI
jgi:hypothetical protein